MLKTMSETLRIGLVVSDMFVPGCPLAYLNEGFAAQTGTYEPVACPCISLFEHSTGA